MEATGRRELEMDFLAAELDRLQSRVDQHFDACRNCGGETEVIGGGHAVDDGTNLVAAGDGPDDGAIVGYGRAPGQPAPAGPIVQAPVDASQLARGGEALQGLVDGGAAAKVGKIAGRPDLVRAGRHAGQ